MGGFGTWALVGFYPDKFAAAAPVCGGGKTQYAAWGKIRIPIWAFHGDNDKIIPLSASVEMIDAIKAARKK